MERTLEYIWREEDEHLRIEQFLRRHGYSMACMAHLKAVPERVLVNGSFRHLNQKPGKGDVLTVHFDEQESSEKILPVELPLDIVYEDEDIVVVNKPAGMPTHPSMKNYENSLANALAFYYREQEKPFVFRCCNRLDRDTSGLTVVAKNMLSGAILSGMTRHHDITREYRAIVRGILPVKEGTIDVPLGRKPGSVIERIVDFENGERAITHYKVLEETGGFSVISLILETGRTHQIRIHMKYLGYPLIGDYLYNPDMEDIQRQALHSCRLAFRHPIFGKKMEFLAPLPQDMGNVLNKS